MARQPDIRYVQIYNHGSTARKLEAAPWQKSKMAALPKPKVRKEKQAVLYVDPLALCAMAAAGLLLIAMVAGMIWLGIASSRTQELETYVSNLQEENVALREEFETHYDMQSVERQALEQGMTPASEAEHVPLELTIPQPEAEPSFFEQVKIFFSELFA